MNFFQADFRRARRALTATAAAVTVSAALLVPQQAAQAAPAAKSGGSAAELSSTVSRQAQQAAADFDAFVRHANAVLNATARDNAWNVRNALKDQAGALAAIHPALPEQARAQLDQIFEALFPGLIA